MILPDGPECERRSPGTSVGAHTNGIIAGGTLVVVGPKGKCPGAGAVILVVITVM